MLLFFFLIIRPTPTSTLFPYTTLFRSASLPLIKERILVIILLLHFLSLMLGSVLVLMLDNHEDRKSGSAGMPRPISYAVFCLKKKIMCISVALAWSATQKTFTATFVPS